MTKTYKKRTSKKNPTLNSREKAMFEALGINPVLYPCSRAGRPIPKQRKEKTVKAESNASKVSKITKPAESAITNEVTHEVHEDDSSLDQCSDTEPNSHGRIVSSSTMDGQTAPSTGATTPNEDVYSNDKTELDSDVDIADMEETLGDASVPVEASIHPESKNSEQQIESLPVDNLQEDLISSNESVVITTAQIPGPEPAQVEDITEVENASSDEDASTHSTIDTIPFVDVSNVKEPADPYLEFTLKCANAAVRIPPKQEFEIVANLVENTIRDQTADIRETTDWGVKTIPILIQRIADTEAAATIANNGVSHLYEKLQDLEEGQVTGNNLNFQDTQQRKAEIVQVFQHAETLIKQLRSDASSAIAQLHQATSLDIHELRAEMQVMDQQMDETKKSRDDSGLIDVTIKKMEAKLSTRLQNQFENVAIVANTKIEVEVDKVVTSLGKGIYNDVVSLMETLGLPKLEEAVMAKATQKIDVAGNEYEAKLEKLKQQWEEKAQTQAGQIGVQNKEIKYLHGKLETATATGQESLDKIKRLEANLGSMSKKAEDQDNTIKGLKTNVHVLGKALLDSNASRDHLAEDVISIKAQVKALTETVQAQQNELKKLNDANSLTSTKFDSFIDQFDEDMMEVREKVLRLVEEEEIKKKSSKVAKLREFFSFKTILAGLGWGISYTPLM
jgi:hypothetical protein